MAPAAAPMAATREGSLSMDSPIFSSMKLGTSSTKAANSVRRGVTSCSGWFGPKPSGNQSSLVGPERASCRLLRIIMSGSFGKSCVYTLSMAPRSQHSV
jgi:hypothetical protein